MNKIEIKCPRCGSKEYECYDEHGINGIHWEKCVCYDCDTQFDIKYVAVEIELD